MAHRRKSRRRRRSEGVVPSYAGLLVYAGALVLINVFPGWGILPVITPKAAPVIALVNLALIVLLVGQALILVDDRLRTRALVRYVAGLVVMVALGQLWILFPFNIESWDPGWGPVFRWVIAVLFAWDVVVTCKAAVALAHGARAPRLASPNVG